MSVTKGREVVAGVVILLGMIQLPGDMALAEVIGQADRSGWLDGVLIFVDLVPALPLVLALWSGAGARIGGGVAWGVILISAVPAALLTLGAGAFGGGATIILIEGAALTLACWGMLLCLSGSGRSGRVGLGLATMVAVWSLVTPLAVAWSARTIAADAPYCIARHETDRPVRSWAELRGVSFQTDRSGYKDSSVWYLHGVMLVDRGSGVEAWNWSPRAMRFDRLERADDLLMTPFDACQPTPGFLAGLPIL